MHSLTLEGMNFIPKDNPKIISFIVNTPQKTTRPGHHNGFLQFKVYPEDPDLCVVSHILEYLDRTARLRGTRKNVFKFFLTHGKPNHNASRDSIKRWTHEVMANAGIDLSIFSAHSTRHASTSAASVSNVHLDTILRAGGWSNPSTFTRFYNLPITPMCSMQSALLRRFQDLS